MTKMIISSHFEATTTSSTSYGVSIFAGNYHRLVFFYRPRTNEESILAATAPGRTSTPSDPAGCTTLGHEIVQ